MTNRTKTGIEILQVSALLGILGNLLLRETPWGLNVFLFVTAFVIAAGMLIVRRKPEFLTGQNAALFGVMLFFSAMFVWRDSVELRIYDTLAILTIMGVLMLPAIKVEARIAGVFHYAVGFIWSGINSVLAPFVLLSSDIKWKPKTGGSKHLIAAIRGLLIALPLVLIFGALFVAADAVFQAMVERVFSVPSDVVISHFVITAAFFWLSAGYFRGLLFEIGVREPAAALESSSTANPQNLSIFDQVRAEDTANPDALPDNATILDHINKSDPPNAEQPQPPAEIKPRQWQNFDNSAIPQAFTLGVVETSIVLGLINLLFLSFVVVQVPYLFGGMELVQSTPDFKLAEYARRGFGELVAVTALVLPILLLTHWLLRKDNPINEKIYRVLAGIQIVLLFVIMASAAQRLVLLTGNLGYGLTTVRFYPMVIMIWFAIVFVWFGLTVLRGARQNFAWGMLWSAFFVLGAIHVVNPDAFIVRTNIRLMNEGRVFDAHYNSALSDDAAPALLESFGSMSYENQCVVKSKLNDRLIRSRAENDLRSWNWSRSRSLTGLENSSGAFDTAGCPDHLRWKSYNEDF